MNELKKINSKTLIYFVNNFKSQPIQHINQICSKSENIFSIQVNILSLFLVSVSILKFLFKKAPDDIVLLQNGAILGKGRQQTERVEERSRIQEIVHTT